MEARKLIDQILKECGAVLERQKHHEVWLLPNGKHFSRSMTPSDERGDRNSLAYLKRVLKLWDEGRGLPGERRERKSKHSCEKPHGNVSDTPVLRTMREQLERIGAR